MPKYAPLTVDALNERIAQLQARVVRMQARDKYVDEIKAWMRERDLDPQDLLWLYRQMKPKVADAPVKSRKALHPEVRRIRTNGAAAAVRGDPKFQAALRKARTDLDLSFKAAGAKWGVSDASLRAWEVGRYIPTEDLRKKVLKAAGLPMHLGAEATAKAHPPGGAGHD